MLLTGPTTLSAERLSDAVTGLAGLVGFLLIPMFGAWLRLLLRFLESESLGLGRRRRLSSLGLLRALAVTVLTAFLAIEWNRAGGELRELRYEAAIVGPSLQGAVVGLGFWLLFAVGLRILRADMQHARTRRRLGGLLR